MMITAGEIEPGTELLINDTGRYVLRAGGQDVEVDGPALAAALKRTKGIAELVARSRSPIARISPPVEAMLEKFGCAVSRP
jgi:hypothetical protein